MNKNPIFVLLLFTILILPIAFQDSNSLRQVAGKIEIDIKPGNNSEFKWGLASDKPNQVTTVELSTEGDGGEFLSFEKTVNIDPMKTVYVPIQVTIPDNYPGNIDLEPHLLATEFGEAGGATVINIRMLKIVNLNIQPNDDPDLWVDWGDMGSESGDDLESGDNDTEQTTQPGGGIQITQPGNGGGCLIATASYGTELAHNVQLLREIRDNTLLSTESGTSFISGFNQVYYMFSPTVADWERDSPIFREAVKLFITPMITSLSIMTLAEPSSEESILGLGISVIILNLGMYFVSPIAAFHMIRKVYKF